MQERYRYHWCNERVIVVKLGTGLFPNTSLAVCDCQLLTIYGHTAVAKHCVKGGGI